MIKQILSFSFIYIFLISSPVFADAILALDNAQGDAGDHITIDVFLNATPPNVTAVNFTLTYDTERLSFSSVEIGDAASSAEKSISSNEPTAGKVVIVIFNLDTNVISNGVIAKVNFNVKNGAESGLTDIAISDYVCSDVEATKVSTSGTGGIVAVSTSYDCDINGNGWADIGDLGIVIDTIYHRITNPRADVTGDGVVTVVDYQAVINAILNDE